MKINYIIKDLFQEIKGLDKNIIIPHVCNNKGGFKSGFAGGVSKHYPVVRDEYLKWFNDLNSPMELGDIQIIKISDNARICNMISQTLGVKRPLRYDKLVSCMNQVQKICLDDNLSIYTCMFGSERAGGDWEFIEDLIEDIWLNSNIEVNVCVLTSDPFVNILKSRI